MPRVYETVRGTDKIRVIVLNEIAREEHNSWWHLFSNVPEAIQYGATHLRPRTTDTSTILIRLFENYKIEGITMPYTIQDFRREFTLEHLNLLSANERLEGLSPEKRLEGLSPEKRLEGLSPEKRLEGLSPEKRLEGLSPELRIEGLSTAELKRLVQEAQRKPDLGGGDSNSNEPV